MRHTKSAGDTFLNDGDGFPPPQQHPKELVEGHVYLGRIKKFLFFYEQPFEIRIIKIAADELKIHIENLHDLFACLSTLFKNRHCWIKKNKIKIIAEIPNHEEGKRK